MVDGQGDVWMGRGGLGGRGRRGATTQFAQATRPTTRFAGGGGPGRPRLICFSNCQHVRIADLRLQKQAVWCVHVLYSQDVDIENLNINAIARIPSSDGMDIDSSRDVRISKCEIACNDDNIAIKSGKDADGLRVNRPSENITISDCIMGVGGGICMGSEVSGGIRNVLVQRCTLNGTDSCARFKSQPSRGGVIENITFRDMTLNNVRQMVDCNMAWRMVGPPLPPANPLTLMHDIHLENFSGTARTAGTLLGLKGGPIEDVTFVNCNIAAQSGLRTEYAEKVNLDGLHVNIQQRGPMTGPTSGASN
jgi:polygalacturonase